MMKIPELLIPAGNLSKLRVALAYGADAVYVGAAGFSMRPDEASFSIEDLREAGDLCAQAGRKLYVGVNSLLFPGDLQPVRAWLRETADLQFDAIIIADPGCLQLVREIRPDLEIHISTQLSTANVETARFWAAAGASRVVLARECTIADAKQIAAAAGPAVEMFIHGAMCVAVSGRCLLSAFLAGKNASQGQCKHSCRWNWQLVEEKRPGETIPVFQTGRETVFLGSKDLCLIEHLPLLADAGVASLKVEGRMKGEYYVGVVTRIYRAALDALAADGNNYKVAPTWLAELETVTHQPYSTGFAFGYPNDDPQKLQTNVRLGGTHNVVGIVQEDSDCCLKSGMDILSMRSADVSSAAGHDKSRDRMSLPPLGETPKPRLKSFHLNHDRQTGRFLKILVKRPFGVGDVIEWIGPAMSGGTVTVEKILSEAGEEILKTHPGNIVTVEIKESTLDIPALALLRCKA